MFMHRPCVLLMLLGTSDIACVEAPFLQYNVLLISFFMAQDMLNFPHRSVFAPAERTFKAEADAPLPLAPAGKVVSAPPPPAREELQKQLDEAAATAASSVAEVNAVKCVVDAAELSAPVELASSPCSMPLL
jgi:hypothetical protein